MNLRNIDLNLLVILDVLLDERHVSRAADRLGLSQPATSNALERCRHLFDDPLLLRAKGVMHLTPRAENLQIPLKNMLADVIHVLDPPAKDLADLCQAVRITCSDPPASRLAGALYNKLAQTAPGINVVLTPWLGAAGALDMLARGKIDLAISVFHSIESSFHRDDILNEDYKVLMRKNHPAARNFNLKQWLAYPHVVISSSGEAHTEIDQMLQNKKLERRIGLVVPSFSMVPAILLDTDLIALLPSRCIPEETKSKYAILPPPVSIDGFPLHLVWHHRRNQDLGVMHVADLIREIVQ